MYILKTDSLNLSVNAVIIENQSLFQQNLGNKYLVKYFWYNLWLQKDVCPKRKGNSLDQKYSRLRCLLCIKILVICFYLGWSGSILQFRQNIIKVGSKSWLLTCSSNITLSLPSYTGSALKRELNFCNGYLSLLYFCPKL